MLLEANNVERNTKHQAYNGYGNTDEVISDRAFNSEDAFFDEVIQSHLSDVFGDARITSWGFPGSQSSFATNFESTQFTWMDISSVVSTWSGSSPRIDSFSMDNNGHAVSGFDGINLIPSESEFLDGVRNGYAFVKENNFRAEENLVDDRAYEDRPDRSDDSSAYTVAQPRLNIDSQNQHSESAHHEVASFRSENFWIGHEVILSQLGGK